MTKELVTNKNSSLLFDTSGFEHAQRVSKMLASSTMVPEHFRNNIGNCVIALNYAHRAGLDPFMVMQKMYVIKGKPAIEAQLQIALFNKSDKFSTLKYRMSGEGDKRQCIAYAKDLQDNEEIEGPPVTIKIAKDEGWYQKNGSKWKTLPDLMLRYRAASFFIRTYAPETTFGLHTNDEVEDMNIIDITPEKTLENEVKENANQAVIDIVPDQDPSNDVEKQEKVFEPHDGPLKMTDEEKAEIEANEMEDYKKDGPSF